MSKPEVTTYRPPARGSITARWYGRFGIHSAQVSVDPARKEQPFSVVIEGKFGPQITDNRRESFRLSREGAIALRDSLTAAIEWRADA